MGYDPGYVSSQEGKGSEWIGFRPQGSTWKTPSWWFRTHFWKLCLSNWIISPGKGENNKRLKPPSTHQWRSTFLRLFGSLPNWSQLPNVHPWKLPCLEITNNWGCLQRQGAQLRKPYRNVYCSFQSCTRENQHDYLENNNFQQEYMFKWWMFHCHLSFGGVFVSKCSALNQAAFLNPLERIGHMFLLFVRSIKQLDVVLLLQCCKRMRHKFYHGVAVLQHVLSGHTEHHPVSMHQNSCDMRPRPLKGCQLFRSIYPLAGVTKLCLVHTV